MAKKSDLSPGAQAMMAALDKVAPLVTDLEYDDIPQRKGETFRSIQVFRCPVCKSLTNHVELHDVGWRVREYNARPICPHRKKEWHKLLKQKLRLSTPAHPASYKKELTVEIEALLLNAEDDLLGSVALEAERKFPSMHLSIEEYEEYY